MNQENMPKHIAIIMDGNRRWAREKGLDIKQGHKEGAKTLEKIVRYANKIGLEYITVYAFSTENWKRAEDEVKALMLLLQNYLDDYSKRADTENIRVKILGDIAALSEGLQKSIRNCMERTKDNTGVTFNIALYNLINSFCSCSLCINSPGVNLDISFSTNVLYPSKFLPLSSS